MNEAIILIGSNIHPMKNIKDCLHLLRDHMVVLAQSQIWKTKSYGNEDPDFLNLAVRIKTILTTIKKIQNKTECLMGMGV